jgi:hypothetical protein
MLARLTRRLVFHHRTREQATFLDSLPHMEFGNDEQLIANVRAIYDKRVPHRPLRNTWRSARPFRT